MTMTEKPSRLEQLREFIKKPHDRQVSDMEKIGKMQHQTGELVWAKEIMLDIITYASNEKLSIITRVSEMRRMVELLKNMAKAKPDNWVWEWFYAEGYVPEMQVWDIWKSQLDFSDEDEELTYDKPFRERSVKSFGEGETIPVILVALNYIFNEFNVPPNAILMLSGIMQTQTKPETTGAPTA